MTAKQRNNAKSIVQRDSIRLVAVFLVGLLVGVSLGYFLSIPSQQKVAPQKTVTVPIGALVELTGDLESYGKRDQRALELAVEDINAFAEQVGSPFRFRLVVEDTGTNPEQARAKIQALAAQGVQAVTGLEASSEVSQVKQFADANKIVVVSVGSTAISLSIAGDYIFRVVPNDAYQGRALARLVFDSGFRGAAVIYRNDAWGKGLFDAFSARFRELGGRVEGVAYDPNAQDVSGEVARLADIASKLGPATAVVLISFEDDGIRVVQAAAQNPTLSKLKWFGTDGVALSTKLSDQVGEQLVALGGLPCTIFQPASNPQQLQFIEKFKSRFKEYPHSYAMNAYDAAWLIALSVMATGQYSGEAIARALPTIAQHYYGVTGNTALDQTGDRAAGDYAIWAVIKTPAGYNWTQIAVYSSQTDTITRV
ncbi:ABC transporter substrate-binding protein [Infirmifilum lucidum]|uniref:ABC transporter substrate-binding protein n=1 Tax=Infirmifilum lucidum TaxID=2776706 RepID=A0A7L9FH45_9CREN|nr:ABC transporter substrate-binding protein [Infirmifilum lucidum]QOJ78333.1 ABC transporter substrate-binding protein [Infirmifilum lucidum]